MKNAIIVFYGIAFDLFVLISKESIIANKIVFISYLAQMITERLRLTVIFSKA